jgi:hypothetical protein
VVRRSLLVRASSLGQALLLLVCLFVLPTVQSQSVYGECYRHLFSSDADQNTFLSQVEFSDALRRVTYGAVESDFASLPASLLSAYATRAQGGSGVFIQGTVPGVPPSASQKVVLDGLCEDIYVGVLDALSIPVNFARCYLYLSIGDLSRNSELTRSEFPRYANQVSDNRYGPSITFEGLPLPMQLVFSDFAITPNNIVNITGTKPGSSPPPELEPIVHSLCRQTLVAVAAGEQVATQAPSPPPQAVTFTFRFCTTAMAVGDQNRDSQMSSNDYARFVNTLSGQKYPSLIFEQLPTVLQENFISKTNLLGLIEIGGARPGDPRTPEQETVLQELCDATEDSLNAAANAPPPPPTLAPTRGPVQTIPYSQCTLSMATSDGNPRSNTLSETEYVDFLNKVQSFTWRDVPYGDLPQPLKTNFDTLAAASTVAGIDIAGSFPGQTPTAEQRAFLEKACFDTAMAIELALYPRPTPPPALSPTVAPGSTTTVPPALTGNLTVFNSFVLSTSSNEEFDEVYPQNDSTNRNNLELAYSNFVSSVVSEFLSSRRRLTRNLRGLAAVGVVSMSAELDILEETTCPEEGGRTFCQRAYGSFDVEVEDENDPDSLLNQLIQVTQDAMNRTEGGLQSFIEAVQPGSSILVMGLPEDGLVRPPTMSPTPAPSPAVQPRSGEDDDGPNVGLIIGIVIAGLAICCCCCIYIGMDEKPFDIPFPSLPSMPSIKRTRTQTDSSIESKDDIAGRSKGDEEAPSPKQRRKMLGLGIFDSSPKRKKPQDDETASGAFSIRDQSAEKSVESTQESPTRHRLSAFGFGKGRKANAPQLGETSPMHNDHESVADYGYEYDDPSVMQKSPRQDADERTLESNDWNPHKTKNDSGWAGSGDPWNDRKRESDSESDSEEESGTNDGSGYGDSDSDEDEENDDYGADGFGDDGEEGEDESEEQGDDDGDDYGDDYGDDGFDDEPSKSSESETYNGDPDEESELNSEMHSEQMSAAGKFDDMVEEGDWDGVVESTGGEGAGDSGTFGDSNAFGDSAFGDQLLSPRPPSQASTSERSPGRSPRRSPGGAFSPRSAASPSQGSRRSRGSTSSNQSAFLKRVLELVRKVVPDEVDNVPQMMTQFAGREEVRGDRGEIIWTEARRLDSPLCATPFSLAGTDQNARDNVRPHINLQGSQCRSSVQGYPG